MTTILVIAGLILVAILVLTFALPSDPKEEERLSETQSGADHM